MPRVEQIPIGNLGTENTLCFGLDDNPLLMNCTMGSAWFSYKSWVAFHNNTLSMCTAIAKAANQPYGFMACALHLRQTQLVKNVR